MTANISNYQRGVIAYLLDGSQQRREALKDLIDRGILGNNPWDDQIQLSINNYLDENPRGFCDDGIDRFRKATNTPTPKPKKNRTVRMVIEAEVDDRWPIHSNRFGADSLIGKNILDRLVGVSFGSVGEFVFKNAQFVDYPKDEYWELKSHG